MKNNDTETKAPTKHLYNQFDTHKGGVSTTHETTDPKMHRSAYVSPDEQEYNYFHRGSK